MVITDHDELLVKHLQVALAGELPQFPAVKPHARMAAVLVPLLKDQGVWKLLFTRRSDDLVDHKGEVSFPGGAVEPTDRDFVDTALREACEEIGLDASQIEVLGLFHAFYTVSNFYLVPVVGLINWPLQIQNNPTEVARTFCIPIQWLADQNNWHESMRTLQNGETVPVIHYDLYEGEILWGITARITQELLRLISKMPE